VEIETVLDLYRLAYMPGHFRCPKCDFQWSIQTINVARGEIGTTEGNRQTPDCPNDGTRMVRVTYKEQLEAYADRLKEELDNVDRLKALLDTPEIEDFDKAVPLEAAHQIKRWGAQHDEGKNPEDWFWLVGYLAGKALSAFKSGDLAKAKHHCISTSAALRNWHAHIRTGESEMRPGISAAKAKVGENLSGK
jgi:hypothetical protein